MGYVWLFLEGIFGFFIFFSILGTVGMFYPRGFLTKELKRRVFDGGSRPGLVWIALLKGRASLPPVPPRFPRSLTYAHARAAEHEWIFFIGDVESSWKNKVTEGPKPALQPVGWGLGSEVSPRPPCRWLRSKHFQAALGTGQPTACFSCCGKKQ